MADKEYYTVEEAADILGVHPDTIRHYIRVRALPAVRIGTVYRIKKKDWDKFIQERYTGEDDNSGERR